MLVLTRKVDEAIVLGEEITISILGIEGDRVRIGIDAPRSMRIFRKELLAETAMINRQAVQTGGVRLSFTPKQAVKDAARQGSANQEPLDQA